MPVLVSHRQLPLGLPEPPRKKMPHGGARPGAGRKRIPEATRTFVAHRARAPHDRSRPVHVTMRAGKQAAFFRRQAVFPDVRRALDLASRAGFRVVHWSVQENHVHLIVEADDTAALRSGVQGLATRLARAVNRVVGRRGKVWEERYHRHDLAGPREVRRALVYVLQNGHKHGLVPRGTLDPLSSATALVGWNARGARLVRALTIAAAHAGEPPPPTAPPSSWLLREGWLAKGGGPLDPRELPAPKSP